MCADPDARRDRHQPIDRALLRLVAAVDGSDVRVAPRAHQDFDGLRGRRIPAIDARKAKLADVRPERVDRRLCVVRQVRPTQQPVSARDDLHVQRCGQHLIQRRPQRFAHDRKSRHVDAPVRERRLQPFRLDQLRRKRARRLGDLSRVGARTAHGRTIRQHLKHRVTIRGRDLIHTQKRRVTVREDRHQDRLLAGAHVRRRRRDRAFLDGRA